METRIQRLEALLQRVRRRASEARGSAAVPHEPLKAVPAPAPFLAAAPPAAAKAPPEPAAPAAFAPPPPPPTPIAAVEEARPVPPVAARPITLQPVAPVQAPESDWPEPVAVAAPLAQASELEVVDTPPPEALGEEDLLEISSDMLESIPPSGGVHVQEREEEPPASSQRPRAAHSLEDELAADMAGDDGREVPFKTPPPESGPQAAPPPMASANVPDMHLLEDELMQPAQAAPMSSFDSLEQPFGPPSRPPPPASGPTLEQLGQTIDLEEAAGPALELDRTAPPVSSPPPPDELEVPLPSRESAGTYDESLVPPPEAREELGAHQQRFGEAVIEAPLAPQIVSVPAAPPLATMPAAREGGGLGDVSESAPLLRELVARPAVTADVVAPSVGLAASARPSTFLELLDSSIELGG